MESLPTEVLECIFSFLPQDDLDSCFQVCDRWAKVIDNIPKKTMWNPWLAKNPAGDAMLTFRHTSGSRFESAEDIAQMRNQISQCPPSERTKNPFKNQTLIINMNNTKDFTALHQHLPEMIKEFGGHVRHLLYYVNHLIPLSVENMWLIFNNMKNIRSVTFYSLQMDSVMDCVRKWDMSTFPILPHFSELGFLGSVTFEYFEVLANVYGPQIQKLSIRSLTANGEKFVSIVGKFPNLNFLKVFEVDPREFLRICLKHIPIRHLSISIGRDRKDFDGNQLNLIDIMETLRPFFSEEFEILTLFWNLKSKCEDCSCNFDGFQASPGSPRSLREVAIPLSLLGTHEFWELLLNFSNLRKLMLMDTKDTFKNKIVGKEELQNLCEPIWRRLSSDLQTISIRSREYNKIFGRFFPVIFTCYRPRPQNEL
ncbi:unnamed protein product [Orchesella dallaii]|uniref:F-box domain-containing protein n=1 Tax=Orchesella dallaii TaxID=48710 RepID=A0ABP1PTA5_9HEXA